VQPLYYNPQSPFRFLLSHHMYTLDYYTPSHNPFSARLLYYNPQSPFRFLLSHHMQPLDYYTPPHNPASALSLSHNLISHSHTLQKNSICFPACSNPMPSFAPAFDVLTQNALYVHPVFLYFPLTLLHFHSEVSPFQTHP